jgi:hypothetical protein
MHKHSKNVQKVNKEEVLDTLQQGRNWVLCFIGFFLMISSAGVSGFLPTIVSLLYFFSSFAPHYIETTRRGKRGRRESKEGTKKQQKDKARREEGRKNDKVGKIRYYKRYFTFPPSPALPLLLNLPFLFLFLFFFFFFFEELSYMNLAHSVNHKATYYLPCPVLLPSFSSIFGAADLTKEEKTLNKCQFSHPSLHIPSLLALSSYFFD